MAKRYIICCAACGALHEVARRDALTCSVACRVWLHRHPDHLAELRALAGSARIEVFDIIEAKAIRELRPDLADRMVSGELVVSDVREDVARAFIARVFEAVEAADG